MEVRVRLGGNSPGDRGRTDSEVVETAGPANKTIDTTDISLVLTSTLWVNLGDFLFVRPDPVGTLSTLLSVLLSSRSFGPFDRPFPVSRPPFPSPGPSSCHSSGFHTGEGPATTVPSVMSLRLIFLEC